MKQNVNFILRGKHPNDDLDNYYQYLCHIFKQHDVLDEEDKIEVNYRNYLQSPLYKAFIDKKTYGKFFQTKPVTDDQ